MRHRLARGLQCHESTLAAVDTATRFRHVTAALMLLILAAALILVPLPAPVQAAEIEATQTKVSVWPEYDDPRVLVIHEADLTESTDLPASVTFNIPKGAEIGMACEVTPAGGHNCKPYKLDDMGDYQALTYTVDSNRKLFVEYYYEAFPPVAGDRSFLVDLRPGFPTESLTLEVQQPARSTGFSTTPQMSPIGVDSDGLNYFTTEFSSPAVGEAIPVSISYVKPDANPSVAAAAAGAATVGGSGATSGAGGANPLLIVAVGLGLGALLVVGYRTFRPAPASGRRPSPSSRQVPRGTQRHGGSSSGRGGGARNAPANDDDATRQGSKGIETSARSGQRRPPAKFCTQCGGALEAGDHFCVSCGSPTR